MSVTDGRPSRSNRIIVWSIGGVVAAGFLAAAIGTRLTFFGEQPSPYDDDPALLYLCAAIGPIAAAGLLVAWIQRTRSMVG